MGRSATEVAGLDNPPDFRRLRNDEFDKFAGDLFPTFLSKYLDGGLEFGTSGVAVEERGARFGTVVFGAAIPNLAFAVIPFAAAFAELFLGLLGSFWVIFLTIFRVHPDPNSSFALLCISKTN